MTVDEVLAELAAQIRARYPLIYVLTNEEERFERLAAGVARSVGVSLARWSSTAGFWTIHEHEGSLFEADVVTATDPLAAVDQAVKGPDRVLYLFEDLHAYLDDKRVVRSLREAARILPRKLVTLAMVGPSLSLPPDLEKEIAVDELPLPTPEELDGVLQSVLEQFPVERRPAIDADLRRGVTNAAAGLSENEARRVFAKVLLMRREFSEGDLALLLGEKKRIIRQSEMLEFFESGESLDTVGGLNELKDWLRSRQKAFTAEAREYGLPQPKGLLLLGVQGCGKSLTSKAVSNLWHLPLLRLDFGAVFSSLSVGPDENLRRALRIAESISPCVLWVDEIEKGLAGLGTESAAAATTTRVLGTFITWMQEKRRPVFVVATANSIEHLPAELLRKGRFDEIFFVDLPNVHERERIMQIHLSRRGRNPEAFPVAELAAQAERFSGAELEESIVSAMYDAFAAGRELSGEDVARAIKDTVPLAVTQEEQIAALKDWARNRARPASTDTRMLDVFGQGAGRR